MKLKIKIKELTKGCMPRIIKDGEWIDLKAARDIQLEGLTADQLKQKEGVKRRKVNFKWEMVPLGVAMQLPKGYEAIVVPRSSTFKKWYTIMTNSMGVIDCSYNGNEDEWKFPVLMFENGTIHKGDRICQFRVQLSQKATMWQKIKWLFTSGIKLVQTDELNNKSRGGFGSTGVK